MQQPAEQIEQSSPAEQPMTAELAARDKNRDEYN